jgi:hypothetical protein
VYDTKHMPIITPDTASSRLPDGRRTALRALMEQIHETTARRHTLGNGPAGRLALAHPGATEPHACVPVVELLEEAARRRPPGHLPPALRCGAIHEWFTPPLFPHDAQANWAGPLCVFIHAAWGYLKRFENKSNPLVLWIGRRVHPDGRAMIPAPARPDDRQLLRRSLFIDPPDDESRLWTIDQALRHPGAIVIADGSGLDMAASRKLQLAAEAGGTLGLLARPDADRITRSAATTRWRLAPRPGGPRPGWRMTLLRARGLSADGGDAWTWDVEWDRVTCALHLSADLVGRPLAQAASPPACRVACA